MKHHQMALLMYGLLVTDQLFLITSEVSQTENLFISWKSKKLNTIIEKEKP